MLIAIMFTGVQSCSKDDLDLAEDEFLVTFLDESSKCHGLLINVQGKDKERIRKVINEEGDAVFSNGSLIIGVFMLKGDYRKGQKLILKLRKPDDTYNGICTAEVMWYKTAFVVEERV